MAAYEEKGYLTSIDKNGNKTVLFPATKIECVDGLEEALAKASQTGSGIYVDAEEPSAAPDNTLWLDLDADGTMTALEAGSITITGTANRKISPSGAILVNGTENHLISQDIPVVPGEQYLLTCSANWENSLYAIYDSNGGMKDNLISPTEAAGRSEVNLLVTIPIGGAFMRVAWNKSVPNAAPFAVTKIKIPKSLDGIAVTVIGDSLVEKNNSAKVNFVDIIAFETGATITNLGVGGTGYMATTDEGEPFYQRAAQIPEGTERVLIYGSGNDRDMKLGTPADTGTDTLCGCINATIDAVYERVPAAWVGIIAPAPWKEYPPYGEKKQFELMVQAQQRICARRGIPFLDLYHASGLRPWDDTFRELAFDAEGVHPNDTGHALIAPQIQAFLMGAIGGGAVASVPDSSQNVDLTGYAKEQWVQEGFQPKGNYLTEVPEGYAKSEDIPTKPEDIGAQPKGDYLTAVPAGYATEEFVKNKIAEAELGGEEVDLSGYAQKSELPTKVSQLQNDSGYLTEHQDISGKLDASALPTAIDTALAQAKASGEFDGKDGKDGQDGYTPKKGVDYFDGENGQDGSPGKDGNDGQPGKDGTSPVISVSAITGGHRITITDANGTKTVDVMDGSDGKNGADGQPGADGSPGQDGQNGSDGVGIASIKQTTTSTADGGDNVFTVTLTNGTSATFTVKNGSKGSTGATGAAGKDGNTSVKIMTKAEYSALIQENVEQMYSNGIRLVIVEDGYTNLVPKATDATGNVYRGCGYLDGYRLTSSGDLSAQGNTCVSGFMPYNHGSTIRIVGSCGDTLSNGGQYVGVYDANYGVIQIAYPSNLVNNGVATWEPRADGLWELTIDTSKIAAWSGAKYFRASCVMCVGADLVVTKNEPIGLEV